MLVVGLGSVIGDSGSYDIVRGSSEVRVRTQKRLVTI